MVIPAHRVREVAAGLRDSGTEGALERDVPDREYALQRGAPPYRAFPNGT
jgi:hypothetical protein